MKLIMAVIKPGKLEEVRNALVGQGTQGMTVSEVRGFGRQRGHKELYRGAEYEVEYLPKVKIELVVEDGDAAKAVEVITEAAKVGAIGDGKVFVLPVEQAVRIRTGESGAAAL